MCLVVYCHINPLSVGLILTEAEVIPLSQAHVFCFPYCLHMTMITLLSLQRRCMQPLFCKEVSPSFSRNKFIAKLPQNDFFGSIFMVMQLMVPPFLQKMPRRRRISTSFCVWMAAVNPWTTTKPATGPECLLMLLWLEMITRLMTSGTFSQRHRYCQALLSFP